MRPLGFLLAIVTGSTLALSIGLFLTWVVILFLPDNEAQFAPEHGPLLRAVAVFSVFAATAAVSFYGEMVTRMHRWRFLAHLATVAMFGVAVWMYWPK
jgi:O-antigen/teichoic acid export membrane protein